MKNYTIENAPVFSEFIKVTETSDPASAQNINSAPKQLLENTLANRKTIEEIKGGEQEIVFEDYTEEGVSIPEAEEAISQLTSGKKDKLFRQYVKASLKGLLALAQRALNIAMGKNQARVFATVSALDAWLAVPENVEQLKIGDNFYITSLDVPDYWWDGAQKQKLETQRVDLTTYDREIAALKQKDSELSGNISSHTHDGRYFTKSEINTKLAGKSDTSHSHAWSAITGKPTTFSPSTHTHDDLYYTKNEINATFMKYKTVTAKEIKFTPEHSLHALLLVDAEGCYTVYTGVYPPRLTTIINSSSVSSISSNYPGGLGKEITITTNQTVKITVVYS